MPFEPRGSGGTQASTTTTGVDQIEFAPVCDLEPVQQVLEDGESLVQCESGVLVGKEVITTATIQVDGKIVAQGPCAKVVPAPEVVVPEFLPSPIGVYLTDETGDDLCQPGETCSAYFVVQNLGTAAFLNPVATLSSPPDQFNPHPISFVNGNDMSLYPDFPAFAGAGDCNTPAQFDPKTNLMAFTFTLPEEQDPDVGRVFNLSFEGTLGTDDVVDMPIVLGVGSVCDPLTDIDGETYDGVDGFQSPVEADLVAEGNPITFSTKKLNLGSTLPLKVELNCGPEILSGDQIDPTPEVVGLVHGTLGPQSLDGINGDNNANPDDPFFHCGTNGCEYQFRTEQLVAGDYVISIRMPDTRVFQAGFTLKP